MSTFLRAAIYARLSTAQNGIGDEESDSIVNQIRDLTKLARREGFQIVEGDFTDDGISGYKGKHRPGFQRLLTAIADGKVDVVLARHSDRLERNEEESFQLRVASVKFKVRWMFSSGMTVDPATAEGGLLAKILSAISEFESKVKTQRLLQHYEGKRTSGTFQAPRGTFGYRGADLVPWEADLIRQAYEDVDAGLTVGSIVRQWNTAKVPQRKGGTRWTYAHLNNILKRPRNAGLVPDKEGNIIDGLVGQWETIVDLDLWSRVNHILSDPSRKTTTGSKPTHMSGGIARCGVCGDRMRSNTVSDKRSGTRYKILRCVNLTKGDVRHPSARIEHLEPLIRAAIIDAFASGPADLFEEDGTSDALRLQAELADYRHKRADVLEMKDMGVIDKAEAIARLQSYEAPMTAIQSRLDELTASSASASMLVDLRAGWRDPETHRASYEATAALRAELGRRFDALHIDQRRHLADTLLEVRVLGGRGVGKYEITHTKVTSLNDEEEVA